MSQRRGITFSDQDAARLERLQAETGATASEIISRALEVYGNARGNVMVVQLVGAEAVEPLQRTATAGEAEQ